MTVVRALEIAVEATGSAPPARARSQDIALEVVSRSGLGINPWQGDNARVSTYVVELPINLAGAARPQELSVEIASRSRLGLSPLGANPGRSDTLIAETSYDPGARALVDDLLLEVTSRSGLGQDPFLGNGARCTTFAVEIVSFGKPATELLCDCVIEPEQAPLKHLMRRPARFK